MINFPFFRPPFYGSSFNYYRSYNPLLKNRYINNTNNSNVVPEQKKNSTRDNINPSSIQDINQNKSQRFNTINSSEQNRNQLSNNTKSSVQDENNGFNEKRSSSKHNSYNPFYINFSSFSDIEQPLIEIMGLKLYLDDVIIIGLLFFLYNEGVKDDILFISLILLLLS